MAEKTETKSGGKEPLVVIARNLTGKILTSNGNTAKETERLMNMFNNSMYGG